MSSIHVLYADDQPVVATPDIKVFNYCRSALVLEARHKVSQDYVATPPQFSSFVKRGTSQPCWIQISMFYAVEQMRELLAGKPAAERPW